MCLIDALNLVSRWFKHVHNQSTIMRLWNILSSSDFTLCQLIFAFFWYLSYSITIINIDYIICHLCTNWILHNCYHNFNFKSQKQDSADAKFFFITITILKKSCSTERSIFFEIGMVNNINHQNWSSGHVYFALKEEKKRKVK